MTRQTEQILEDQLMAQLTTLGYAPVAIGNEAGLLANLKTQLETHNNIQFTEREFAQVLNTLAKGNVFEKAHTLRQRQHLLRDDGDNLYFEFINTEHWCQNRFQVTRQVSMEGSYSNRYDVTLLINGLPLVQIELKRRGMELKEAFNQLNRYQRHSFADGYGLYQYVQIFVISNGVNTKYFANNRQQSFKQTFYWTDAQNKRLTNILNGFTAAFLEPCHLSKMICKYIVLNETFKVPMVLRPYQYYAVEALVDRVVNGTHNGYVWHTTGSGKTLTSFKASQVLTQLPQVKKVVFVVDRKDLDYQTIREFNAYRKDCVDGTNNTSQLVRQFTDDTKLIVTTLQKLNTAISKTRYLQQMERLRNERVVFIFDECHRSQFGDTHNRIKAFFAHHQLFGFTGTPIFADNAVKNELGRRTTKELFGDCLHKYVITDAIRDENVLKFSVEYVGRYYRRDAACCVSAGAAFGGPTEIDIEVEAIDTRELMESPQRLEKIARYILAHHGRKTHSRKFTAMFCTASVDMLITYYDIFRRIQEAGEHNLRIATIFSYGANEEDPDATGFLNFEEDYDRVDFNLVAEAPPPPYGKPALHREKLEEFIGHYNQQYGTAFSTADSDSFYRYYQDISKRVRAREVDILLVVNMFLTGFDSPPLNTLYVDKNLKHHGLIQAYSRTNRVVDEQKSQGNIVAFRNLKNATDEAITLFSNKEAIEVIIMQPYEDYVKKFNEATIALLQIVPTVNSVNELETEEDELAFISAFRDLMRIHNILKAFANYTWEDLSLEEQRFEDYKSKYLDLHEKVKNQRQKEKVSILEDVDFELELIHRDEINVAYIIQLLLKLKSKAQKDVSQAEKEIFNLLNTEAQLRSKRELIEQFIQDNLPLLEDGDDLPAAFADYWNRQQQQAFQQLVKDEDLDPEKTQALLEDYLYAEREPLRDELLALRRGPAPGILQRKPIADRLLARIVAFVETFINGMEGV